MTTSNNSNNSLDAINPNAYGYKSIDLMLELKPYSNNWLDCIKQINMRLGELNFLNLPEYLHTQVVIDIVEYYGSVLDTNKVTGIELQTLDCNLVYDIPENEDLYLSKQINWRVNKCDYATFKDIQDNQLIITD